MTNQPENMQQTPEQDAVELQSEGTEVQQPTTSPDVVITDDPGPAPDPETQQNDDSDQVIPLEPKVGDPLSDDEAQDA